MGGAQAGIARRPGLLVCGLALLVVASLAQPLSPPAGRKPGPPKHV